MQQKLDYTPFLALFQNGTLTLTNMTISAEACTQLDQISEIAMNRDLAALSSGQAIELVNRDEIIAQQVPYIKITTEAGTLSLPACHFRLVSFEEIVERLLPALKTFELFLFDKDLPRQHTYRRNLAVWRHLDADLVAQYRAWLPRYVAQSEHETKTTVLLTYCQLACADGYLSADHLDAIAAAMDKPLPRQSTRAKRKHTSE
jgi:hypothetical protein